MSVNCSPVVEESRFYKYNLLKKEGGELSKTLRFDYSVERSEWWFNPQNNRGLFEAEVDIVKFLLRELNNKKE